MTLPEALAEIERLRALGDRLAGALELVTADMHAPIPQRGAARDTLRDYICLIEGRSAMDVLATPVAEWIVGRGMKLDDLRREKETVAAALARSK